MICAILARFVTTFINVPLLFGVHFIPAQCLYFLVPLLIFFQTNVLQTLLLSAFGNLISLIYSLSFFFSIFSLELWGYKRVEEIIWVKTNQLQRIIRTGRTGHWLNHSKEHCLVGIKGNPLVNRNIDTDVIVAEVRETSRKPDEVLNFLFSYYMLLAKASFDACISSNKIAYIPRQN